MIKVWDVLTLTQHKKFSKKVEKNNKEEDGKRDHA